MVVALIVVFGFTDVGGVAVALIVVFGKVVVAASVVLRLIAASSKIKLFAEAGTASTNKNTPVEKRGKLANILDLEEHERQEYHDSFT